MTEVFHILKIVALQLIARGKQHEIIIVQWSYYAKSAKRMMIISRCLLNIL